MTQDFRDRIEYEYDKFFMEMMSTSKENIFAKSKEIEEKKKIRDLLIQKSEVYSEEQILVFCGMNNIIESAFRYFTDSGKELKEAFKEWELHEMEQRRGKNNEAEIMLLRYFRVWYENILFYIELHVILKEKMAPYNINEQKEQE